ncbi:Gfo/Idh/MocA family protein [Euzebya tangerina]|uniref:Gfo/Idh/MocA family protein n=1 Tax=Euzebya tangerina TaxID=591198 RepID=UPI000E30E8AB|nr:Gfo/Idh/MocA family oxidoreductase [Euzebya tangerina]
MGEIRYGIVGAGMMGQEHIMNLRHLDGAVVTAVADPHEPSRAAAAEVLAGADVTYVEDHHELLASGRVDAVVVATPNMTHRDILLDLLETDLHILVEKPLCTTVEDCRTVIAAAEGREALTWVGLEYRFMPPVARLVEEVQKGTTGPLRMVSVREHRFPFLPKVDDWNRFNENTGGTLVEKACHFFDLMNLLTAATPVRVLASGGQDVNFLNESYDGRTPDILDNAYVIVEYDSGARAVLDLCMFAEAGRDQSQIIVVGDAATVESRLPVSEFSIGRRGESWFSPDVETATAPEVPYMGHHEGSSYVEHTMFRDAIRSGIRPEVSLKDGLLSVAMGVAAHRSIEERRAVTMAEVLDPAG